TRPLTPRLELYVAGRLRGLSSTAAAVEAGYGPAYARKASARIETIPAVREAIQHGQAELRSKTMYDVAAAVREIDKAIAFSYEKSSAISLGKLLTLKAQLHGLLIDRHEVVNIQLAKSIQDARSRVSMLLAPPLPALDVSNGAAEPERT